MDALVPGCLKDRLDTAGTKLRSSTGVYEHDTVGFVSSQSDPQRGHGQIRGDPVADSEPRDPVGEQVLDGVAVDLAFSGWMLGQVPDPLTVWTSGREVPAQQVTVHRRPGSFAFEAFLHGAGPQALLGTQPPGATFSDFDPGPLELIS